MGLKRISLLFTLAFAVLFATAQEPTFLKDDKVVNLGLGLGSGLGTYYNMAIPPVSISAEYGFMDEVLEKGTIGVGAYLGFSSYKYKSAYYNSSTTRIYVGPRGSFHYPIIDNLDTYVGLSIGLRFYSWNDNYDDFNPNSGAGVYSSWFAGARYYITDNLAVMGELGYGITYLNIGVALKL